MSDDDCDIFSIPVKRPIGFIQSSISGQEEKQTDYDFINCNTSVKNPNKMAKQKAEAQPKRNTKAGRSKKLIKNYEVSETVQVLQEAPSVSDRAMSPVSLLIFEMEQKQAAENAKKIEVAPIARRTRSSLGKRNPIPDKQTESVPAVPAQAPAPSPKKRNTRGKKKATVNPSVNVEATDISRSLGSRQQVAELAARSTVLDSIDLVSAVMPRVEGFINLDSGDESQNTTQIETPTDKEQVGFNENNQVLEINLCWLGEIQKYKLRRHQKFMHMFKEVAERNQVPLDDVVISKDDQFIAHTVTPESVGLMVYHILSGCAIKSKINSATQLVENVNPFLKPKKFQLKIQADKWKKPLIIQMKKTETFNILYIKCSEEMECDVRDIKLFFDGDLLEPDDTPKNQDMEGNELIDLRLKLP